MALLDIFKMKKLGGTVLLKDNSFLYISKVTGTQFEEKGKDMRILYEDGNGVKKEFMISQVKEARPVEEHPQPLDAPFSIGKQSVFTLLNNMNKLKECEDDEKYKLTRQTCKINLDYVSPETLDKDIGYNVMEEIKKELSEKEEFQKNVVPYFKAKIEEILPNLGFVEEEKGLFIYHSNKEMRGSYVTGYNSVNKLTFQPPIYYDSINVIKQTYDTLLGQAYMIYEDNPKDNIKMEINKIENLFEEINEYKSPSSFIENKIKHNNEPGSFKKRKITEVPLMDDDLETILNRTREESYKLVESMIDKGVKKFEFCSQTVPADVYEILIMTKGKKKSFAVLQNDNEDVFILDMNSLFIVNAIKDGSRSVKPSVPKPSFEEPSVKIETNDKPKSKDYPGGPWFLNKRRKLDVSSLQDVIRGDDCKSIIVPGEPALYNAYLKRDLKETMIENLIKKELSNDLNILLDEIKNDSFKELLIYVGDDVKPHTMIRVDKEGFEETYGLTMDWSFAEIKCSPLPAHLKCLTPTRYVDEPSVLSEEDNFTEEKYFTPKKTKEIKVPDAPRKKVSKDDTFKDPANLNIDDMVTFLYKGEEKRVLVKESNDKYLEGICQEQNKYKKYLVRYIERPRVSLEKGYPSDDDDTDTEVEEYMPYKRMVLNAIKDMYVNGTRGSSRQAIQAYLLANYNHHINESRFQDNLRRTLRRLVETGCIVQNKQKFKLGDEGRKYLKNIILKELKPDTRRISSKKGNSTQNDNSKKTHHKGSKHDLIQYAIDNEKILDIIYDGGSIPDINRPIRPLKVFKTAYSNKEILQATCLIDDNVKNFTLDKVTIIE